MADIEHFTYDVDKRWSAVLLAVGFRSSNDIQVDREEGVFRAKFGWASFETPLSNIDHTEITGPHRWYTAVGLRLSFVDDGITFGTNNRLGLCVAFKEPIKRIIGFKNHSALWVSVAEPEKLADALNL